MNERLLRLRQRRGELLGIIAAQRTELAASTVRWEYPLTLLDKGFSVVGYVRSHPLLLAGVVGALLIRRPNLAGWVRWGVLAWRGFRYLDVLKSKLAAAKGEVTQRL